MALSFFKRIYPMACIVYREGAGTIEHGIECESTACDVNELHSLLSAGWSQTPPGYVPPDPVVEEEEDPQESGSDDQDEALLELMEENEGLRKELELRIGIEENLNATIKQLKEDLASALHDEEPEGEDLNPVRAAGRDSGIEGWETMHLSSLKKALKDLEA